MHVLLVNTWRARRTGRTPVFLGVDFGAYSHPSVCPGRGLECYLQWHQECDVTHAGATTQWAADLRSSDRVAYTRLDLFGDFTHNFSCVWGSELDPACTSQGSLVSSTHSLDSFDAGAFDPLVGHPHQFSQLFHVAEILRMAPLQPWVVNLKGKLR